MLPYFKKQGRLIHLLAGSLLLTSLLSARAEEAVNELTDITLNPQGDMILNITGEGFDPQLHSRRLPDGAYQITIAAKNVIISPQNISALEGKFKQWIPAVQSCLIASDQYGFQLNLTSWQPLQPQIKSNSGEQIVIHLNGDNQLPSAIVAQQKKEAEFKQQAEQKRLQALAIEKEKAALLQQQQAAAAKKLEQDKKLAAERLLKQQKAQEEATKLAAIQKQQALEAKRLALQKQKETERLQALKALEAKRVPSIAVNKAALDTDWPDQETPVPLALQATDEVVELTPSSQRKSSLASASPHFETVFTPQMLAQDKKPMPGAQNAFSEPLTDEDETAPSTPLRLHKTPANYDPDSKTQQVYRSFRDDSVSYSEYTIPSEPAIRRAWENMQTGQADNAELDLRSFLERNPNDIEARFLLALLLEQKARKISPNPKEVDTNYLENARSELLKIINQQAFLPAYLKLIDQYLDEGNLSDAGKLLDKVIPLYQQSAEVWFHKGRLSEFKNELNEAKAAYTNALTLDPKHPEYHYRLAQIHLKQEHWSSCRLELLQTLAISPDDARCWKLLGYLAEKQGAPQQAAQWYKASLQPDVMIYYARLLEKQNQPQQALSLYQAVESIAGEDMDLLFNLAMIYSEGQHPQRTEALLKRFLKLSTNPDDTRVAQAKTLLKQINVKSGKR